jgi:DNA-binding MarR family transcriptional regulator
MGISSARVDIGAPTDQIELDEVELGAWRGLVRVHAALARELDAELDACHGLPLSSYEVLRSLSKMPAGRMRMAELAEHVLLSRSGMTRLIDRLEREGLVSRSTCDKDGRGCYAVLTEHGRAKVEQARGTHIAVVRDGFLRHFSEGELRELATLFGRALPETA